MSSVASVHARGRSRWALIVAGIFALLGSFVVTAPATAQVGYYPCSYGCGYPVYHYRPRCYSCGPHLIYERRYVEREYIERHYGCGGCGYGGYRRPYGYGYGGYRRPYGYYGYGGYRRPYGYPYGGYGYGGIGRRWPVPYFSGYGRSGLGGAGYEDEPGDDEN